MTNNETFGTSAQLSYIKLAALTAKWLCNFPLPPLHSLTKKGTQFVLLLVSAATGSYDRAVLYNCIYEGYHNYTDSFLYDQELSFQDTILDRAVLFQQNPLPVGSYLSST